MITLRRPPKRLKLSHACGAQNAINPKEHVLSVMTNLRKRKHRTRLLKKSLSDHAIMDQTAETEEIAHLIIPNSRCPNNSSSGHSNININSSNSSISNISNISSSSSSNSTPLPSLDPANGDQTAPKQDVRSVIPSLCFSPSKSRPLLRTASGAQIAKSLDVLSPIQ